MEAIVIITVFAFGGLLGLWIAHKRQGGIIVVPAKAPEKVQSEALQTAKLLSLGSSYPKPPAPEQPVSPIGHVTHH